MKKLKQLWVFALILVLFLGHLRSRPPAAGPRARIYQKTRHLDHAAYFPNHSLVRKRSRDLSGMSSPGGHGFYEDRPAVGRTRGRTSRTITNRQAQFAQQFSSQYRGQLVLLHQMQCYGWDTADIFQQNEMWTVWYATIGAVRMSKALSTSPKKKWSVFAVSQASGYPKPGKLSVALAITFGGGGEAF